MADLETAYTKGYDTAILMHLQQKGSKLRPLVDNVSQHSRMELYTFIQNEETEDYQTRNKNTVWNDTAYDRRAITLAKAGKAIVLSPNDLVQMNADPVNGVTTAISYAIGRKWDRIIAAAMFGDALTGQEGDSTTSFSASQIIAKDYVPSGSAVTSGLTLDKLIRAKEIHLSNFIDEGVPLTILYRAKQLSNMLREVKATSRDYVDIKSLMTGEIDAYMGFRWVHYEGLPETSTGSGVYKLPVFTPTAIKFATGSGEYEYQSSIDRLVDKQLSIGIQAYTWAGAVRMEEKQIVEIDCAE